MRTWPNANRCLVCGERSRSTRTIAVIRGWNYVRCPQCGLMYLDPKPEAEDLRRFYNTAYQYDLEAYREATRRAEAWLSSLEAFSPSPRSLLEIGCSFGFLLEAARRRGWQVRGVELGAYAADYAREQLRLPVATGSVFDLPVNEEGTYSSVVAWHLLEHEPDPVRFLERVRALMRPGGVLSLRVPNIESLIARLAGPCWQWLSPPEHIYLFTERALVRLLSSSGFEIVSVGSSRGPAHNLWFEILRARTKQVIGLSRSRSDGRDAAANFERPPVYENRWWYRLGYRVVDVSTSPLQWALSPWLGRHLLEAELVLFARKPFDVGPPVGVKQERSFMPSFEPASAGNYQLEAAARASFLKMTRTKWRIVRAAERIVRLSLPFLPSPPDWPSALPASILVLEYWNLGDLAILLPFLGNLRRSFPRARISLLVNADLQSFLKGQGIVDDFIPVRVPWAQHFNRWKKYSPFSRRWILFPRTLLALRKRHFDWAFSGRMDLRDNFLMWLIGARRRIGYGIGGGGFLLTDRVLPDVSRPHRADVWLRLLSSVGVSPIRQTERLRLTDAERIAADSFLAARGIPPDAILLGVHPGARIATRRWGDERFAEVARRLLSGTNVHVLWFSEPGKPSTVPQLPRCHPVGLEFRRFLAVLARCRLLICNDSGPMHLANLLGVPVVAVFGPQRPEWFGPRGPKDRVVIQPEIWCRPCFDYCIFDQPYCLRTIVPAQVLLVARAAIREICNGESDPAETLVQVASEVT